VQQVVTTMLTAQAGGAMQQVIGSTARFTTIMTEMTAATREQSLGIAQVSQAVNLLDTVTQQNAALVEEAAAAAGHLSEQTDNLTSVLAVFKPPGSDNSADFSHASIRFGLKPLDFNCFDFHSIYRNNTA